MLTFLRDWNFDPIAEFSPPALPLHPLRGAAENTPELDEGLGIGGDAGASRPLPFVYVFGRSNFTVSYFGANIYPENVTVGLEQPEIKEWVTGKFVLQVKETSDHNLYLSITVELAPGAEADDQKREAVTESILTHLLRLNSEFANYVPAEYRRPQVSLAPTGDPEYFPIGVKHSYTRR
jgi:phenylacetate-CoA ligase